MSRGIYDDIMAHDVTKSVTGSIEELPNRGKFRAYSSIRALNWASTINSLCVQYPDSHLHIPACYCALHATEEAVAAFISTAKEGGYGDDAKINLRDHKAKSVISLIAQKTSNFLHTYKPEIGYDSDMDSIILRIIDPNDPNEKFHYVKASTDLISIDDKVGQKTNEFYDYFIAAIGGKSELKSEVENLQNARNKVFYATKTGLPSGFEDSTIVLNREVQISLGLIWASIDIFRKKEKLHTFIVHVLRTANLVISEL